MTKFMTDMLRVKNGPCQADRDDFQVKRMMVPNTKVKLLSYCFEFYYW